MNGMRGLIGLALLLCAWIGPAAAMDPSAMEETNCLMACDANQENCLAGHGSSGKFRPLRTGLQGEPKLSRSLRPTTNFSQMDRGVPPKERLR